MEGKERPLTVKEAAIRCGLSTNGIYEAIAAGRLPATRPGKNYYIDPEDLRQWQNDPGQHKGAASPEGFLSIQEAAAAVFYHHCSIRNACYRGEIEYIKKGHRLFLKVDSVKQWAADRGAVFKG